MLTTPSAFKSLFGSTIPRASWVMNWTSAMLGALSPVIVQVAPGISKFAVTEVGAFMVICMGFDVPDTPPLQPVKTNGELAVAVSVTVAPEL